MTVTAAEGLSSNRIACDSGDRVTASTVQSQAPSKQHSLHAPLFPKRTHLPLLSLSWVKRKSFHMEKVASSPPAQKSEATHPPPSLHPTVHQPHFMASDLETSFPIK